ncbi:MAG: hypothetical protein ACE5F9_02370 [Phycisphaerae bacterium]
MPIPGGGITRVSNSLQAFSLLSQLRGNTLRVFREQQRIASGERLLSISDDPIAAEKITRLSKSLESQQQILRNLRHADSQLAAGDSAITDIHDLLIQAVTIASDQASNLRSAEERASEGVIVDSLIEQLKTVGNQQFQNQFLFGGRRVDQAPFNADVGRVTYVGDTGDRQTLVDPQLTQSFNVVASDLFNLRQPLSGGYAQFTVQLSSAARLSELDGAPGAGLRFGPIQVTEVGPGTTFTTDFTGAETVGDIVARFNADATAAGTTLTMSISGTGLQIVSGGGNSIQVAEVGSGTMAADLGIAKTSATPLVGDDVNRRITTTTAISDLGSGFSLPNGVVMTNGTRTSTVTFAGATTVGDVLNDLNNAGVAIRASINTTGTAIDIENLAAGTDLLIGENGGTDADKLGIRTTNDGTLLSDVSRGRGIHPVSGNDLQIADANGISFQVDVSNSITVGDAIAAINAASTAAGSSIVAQRSPTGGGLRLTGAAGPGTITVQRANLSPVASELGILKTGTATQLDGDNVFSFRQSGLFSALYRLRDGLFGNDSSEITEAGSDLEEVQKHVANIQGIVGARSQSMRSRLQQTEDATTSTTILLSELKDVDLTEAITKFQQAQTALQSTILSGNQSLNLSLLDFLR